HLDRDDAAAPVGGDGDHAAAGLGRRRLLGEGFLRLGHLLLHLHHLAEEVGHVGLVHRGVGRSGGGGQVQTISPPNCSTMVRMTGCSCRSCLIRSNGSAGAAVSAVASPMTKASGGGSSPMTSARAAAKASFSSSRRPRSNAVAQATCTAPASTPLGVTRARTPATLGRSARSAATSLGHASRTRWRDTPKCSSTPTLTPTASARGEPPSPRSDGSLGASVLRIAGAPKRPRWRPSAWGSGLGGSGREGEGFGGLGGVGGPSSPESSSEREGGSASGPPCGGSGSKGGAS